MIIAVIGSMGKWRLKRENSMSSDSVGKTDVIHDSLEKTVKYGAPL